jgi:uncharacterized damage-inducible protein DinB
MSEILRDLVSHMRWADTLIADALERDATNDAESARLFAHIASVEHLWYARIQGQPAAHAVWPSLTVAESRALAAEHADRFAQLVESSDTAALARRVDYRNSAGLDFHNTVADIVTHLVMHGSHHRGQILRQLRAAGIEPPYVDYIQFARREQLAPAASLPPIRSASAPRAHER